MKTGHDQIQLQTFRKQLRFHRRRGAGHLVSYLKNRMQWHLYPRIHKVSRFPLHLDVEISSVCNMRCPMCYTTTELFKDRVNQTLMEWDLYTKIIDEASQYGLFSIRLSLRGEAFLNPNAVKMTRYAKEKGIKEVSSLTNDRAMNPDLFKDLMESGLDWLTVSFDGWGKTYEQIRKPLTFEESYENVKAYARLKAETGSRKPALKVQTIWPAIAEDPARYCEMFEPYVDEIAANPLIDFLREDKERTFQEGFCCPSPWRRMAIGADGHILMCHADDWEDHLLGDANVDPLYDIWHGEGYERVRKAHMACNAVEGLRPCCYCSCPREEETDTVELADHKVTLRHFTGRDDSIERVLEKGCTNEKN